MTEKILPYNRDLVAQETGFWCGPASAQMVLSDRGIHVDEMQLARECSTHEGGTDHLGLIEEVLNRYVHDADYITVWLRNDPPTDSDIEEFWNNLRTSIDAGFGLVLNFVAPANNIPFPIKGSGPAPSFYNYGTTYHYTSAHGYSDDGGQRAVWIADSGGAPFGYWLTLAQTVLLAAGKGYIYAKPHGVVGVPNLPGPAAALDLAEALSLAMGGSLSIDRYRELVPGVCEALRASNCNTPRRIAQWFAQIGHESAGLRYMEELADGSAYEGRADLGNTQPGDGCRFKGHGPIQITGRENHRQVSEWAYQLGLVPSPDYFLDFPTELGSDKYGFLGAAWYWTVARGNQINEAADCEDINQVTRLINGGLHGIDDRTSRYHMALQVADQFVGDHGDVPGIPTLPGPAPVPTQVGRFYPVTADSFVTSPFGPRDGGHHSGADFGFHGGAANRPVFAIQSGTVMFSGEAQGYGGPDPAGWLVIDSDDSQGGGVWEYGHIIREPHLTVGARVSAGDKIGVINPSEVTNGGVPPHLHLAHMPRAYNPGEKLDPLPVLEGAEEPAGAPTAPTAPPAPQPEPEQKEMEVGTPLTGRPHHHSQIEDLESQLLNVRAEGLITQALLFAVAEAVGVNAREVYDRVRDGF